MKITVDYATGSDCYKSGQTIVPKGLMIHSVGVNQPDAKVFARIWKTSTDVCCHGVLSADGTVIQTLPWNRRGWHCGGSGNNTHIGVEMAEPSTIRYTGGASFIDNDPEASKKYVLGTYKTAVELFAYLCRMYGLNPTKDGVIISHNEGYKKGIASGHADVEHIWNKYGLTMNQFRKDIKAAIENANNADIDDNSTPYIIRVSIDDLNIRTGPGTEYPTTGNFTGKGSFTITQTQNNWGKLKSGAGWIYLGYAEKV